MSSNLSRFSFTVDRAKWRCGDSGPNLRGIGRTQLRNSDGYQCCLGFACVAAGIAESKILSKLTPVAVSTMHGKDIPHLTDDGCNSEFTKMAMDINDNGELTDREREEELILLGKTMHIDIDFIGEYKQSNMSVKTP